MSRTITQSVLKHLFIQELYLKGLQNLDFNVKIGDYNFKEVIDEIMININPTELKMLELPTGIRFQSLINTNFRGGSTRRKKHLR